ncbi:MAG: hypothetical protein SVU88_04930 [Candidatus Nanohaloarchaea archaeon]|nr:hypothetical protein [Candidatus Nanohaloarchaea archaeon]
MLDRLTQLFRDPLQLDDPGDAAAELEASSGDALADARATADRLQADADDLLQALDRELAGLEGFEDAQDRPVVEDVVGNVVADRRQQIDQMRLPDAPADLYDALDEFIDEFRTMKRKEEEVLKNAVDAGDVFDALEEVAAHRDRVGAFLDAEYGLLEAHSELSEAVDRLDDLRAEHAAVEDDLAGIDTAGIRQDIQDVEAELDTLHGDDAWADYQRLQEDIDDLRTERDETVAGLDAAAGKMERGLRKLLYADENGDIDIPGDTAVLADIRDGELDAVLDRDPSAVAAAVDAAVTALPDDLLGERQADRFAAGADRFRDIAEYRATLTDLSDRIDALEEELDGHPAPAREDELTARLDDLQEDLRAERERRTELQRRRDELEDDIAELEAGIMETLRDVVDREVELA